MGPFAAIALGLNTITQFAGAREQRRGFDRALGVEERALTFMQETMQPFIDIGTNAARELAERTAQLQLERSPNVADFVKSPDFEFLQREGEDSLDRQFSRGLLRSGARVEAGQDFTNNLISGELDRFINRNQSVASFNNNAILAEQSELGRLAAMGQGGAQFVGSQTQQGSTNIANTLIGQGQSRGMQLTAPLNTLTRQLNFHEFMKQAQQPGGI